MNRLFFATLLTACALVALTPQTVHAQEDEAEAAPVIRPYQQNPAATYLTAEELTELEAMDIAGRKAWFAERQIQRNQLGDAEREQRLAARRAAFSELSEEEQADIRARSEALFTSAAPDYTANAAKEKAGAKRQYEKMLSKMTPEQRAKLEEIRKNSAQWEPESDRQ